VRNETVSETPTPLLRTPLYDAHVAAGAKMVPFAGYDMPVQYPLGVLKEHLWTRTKAGLFDVSHMGQATLVPEDGRYETAARALETLVPADILGLSPGQQRYSQLLTDDGGILDDLMITRPADTNSESALILVVNAACKDADYAHIEQRLPHGVDLVRFSTQALIALQGPAAAGVMARLAPEAAALSFMTADQATVGGIPCYVSRSGYTGEDGFEISLPASSVVDAWRLLTAEPDVETIGLGARDSLRLEAGLCLYGHDIDTTTSPIEAGLAWSIQKRRRDEGGFPGASRIQREISEGPKRRRVGIRPDGRAPAREGTEIRDGSGRTIGTVTSGGFGPSVNGPVAMGYVEAPHAAVGTRVDLIVRSKPLPAAVVPMPFTPHRYFRKPKS
jgi:aminomethyltransferase